MPYHLNIKAQCDVIWAKIIKLLHPFCWYPGCGAPATDACHVKSRSYMATRWDIENGLGGCRIHHIWETNHPSDARQTLENLLGKKKYQALHLKAMSIKKYFPTELVELRDNLKAEHARLEETHQRPGR